MGSKQSSTYVLSLASGTSSPFSATRQIASEPSRSTNLDTPFVGSTTKVTKWISAPTRFADAPNAKRRFSVSPAEWLKNARRAGGRSAGQEGGAPQTEVEAKLTYDLTIIGSGP